MTFGRLEASSAPVFDIVVSVLVSQMVIYILQYSSIMNASGSSYICIV